MLRLVYSNGTEELLTELANRVRAQQETMGVLVPVRIVVPNATVEEHLRLGVARRCGIAANLQTTLMTAFASEIVGQAMRVRLAGAEALEAMALTLLLEESFLNQPELVPVRAYLAAGESRETADVRRVQLAARIGRLFEEYTYSRTEMLEGWSRAPTLDGQHAETERWQRRLWLSMFEPNGLGRARGLIPLHEAIAALSPLMLRSTGTVHVYGFPHFARAFHRLFGRIAVGSDVIVYSLSPCEGFWEDIDENDPTLLRLWGRPGREHVRALNANAGFDHDDHFVEPSGTLLACLQRDVMRREPPRERLEDGLAFEGDQSIVLLEHASVRRELEAVASEIWRLLEGDEALRFDDIAVLVPDSDASVYATHLTAVFREAHDIPHRLIDIPGTNHGIGEAIELLLSLPLGRFTRQDLLRLAVHPAVVASLEGVDPQRWLEWSDALGIVHGADRTDHDDTYIARDILNWDQGLRRLALGAFMAGDASGERRPFELAEEAYVPHEVALSEMRDAATFGLLVRSLVADARFVHDAELSTKDWATLLCAMVETYVAPTDGAEAEVLARCLRRLHGIGNIDVGQRSIAYSIAHELARGRIDSLQVRRGVEGVVVSRLVSVRPIPFRVVFACGMGEGCFPSIAAEDTLDLRWARRREGDVTALERDKYAFLEILLATRDRLYLSYVSRDPLTGDTLAASSVVQELLHTLGRGYVRDLSRLRRQHPLRRWDPRYFAELFPAEPRPSTSLGTMRLPEAHAEATVLALRRSMEAHDLYAGRADVETRAASDPAWAALAEHLRIAPLPEQRPPGEATLTVPVFAVVKFLEFPLQGWARFRIGLDEREEEDTLAREDEPFETDFRDETLLLRGVLLAAARSGSLEHAYDEVVLEREIRGTGPSGVFAQGERAEHLRTLEGWKERLDALGFPLDAIEIHRFGRSGQQATADHAHPPLILDVDYVDASGITRVARVEMGGRTLPLARGRAGAAPDEASAGVSITLLRRAKDNRDDWARADRQRLMLRAFVDHAVFSASGMAAGQSHASLLVVATPQGSSAEQVRFDPMSRGEAHSWLRGLARELLNGPHAYFFPAEAVLLWQTKTPGGSVVPWLEAAREMLRDDEGPLALRSAYGPVPRPHEYPIPEESVARAMIARRFEALFERRREQS
jgi:exodeoxyribonuclease V gamma subunit